MSYYLETAAKVAFCTFLILALWSVLNGTWYWLFGVDGPAELFELVNVVLTATVSVLFFLIAKALTDLSRITSDDGSLLNRVSEVAASVSDKARKAAKAHVPNDSD